MPDIRPRTKLPKEEQLTQPLQGELATYERVGLYQRSVTSRTAYRYRGVLLQYQKALKGAPPTLNASVRFLAHLRKQGFSPSSLRVHRAALQGFHAWRGENLVFPIRVPHHAPSYVEDQTIGAILNLAKETPRDYLILQLMAHAGLRRQEVVNLKVKNVGERALRFRGKGDRDRTVPMTNELKEILRPFCSGKGPDDRVVGGGEGVIYRVVKNYGKRVGKPDLKPHDLRHAFATRLLEREVNIRVVQELLGHSNLNTTQIYTSVSGRHLEDAINVLSEPLHGTQQPEAPGPVKELCVVEEERDKGRSQFARRDREADLLDRETFRTLDHIMTEGENDLLCDRKIFNTSDRIMNERDLRDFLISLELHRSYKLSEYLKVARFWEYFELEGNKYTNPEARQLLDNLWYVLDDLVLDLRLEFEQGVKSKKQKDSEFRLSPSGFKYLRNDSAKVERIAEAENQLDELIKATRDNYKAYRVGIRNRLHV